MKSNDNLFAEFMRHFPADRSKPLLITPDGHACSYADALDESGRMARCLSDLGLRAGDRVSVQVHKTPAALWLYLACLRGGFVFQPLNTDYQREELAYFIKDAKPAAIVCDPERETLFHELSNRDTCAVLTLDASGKGSLTEACLEMPPAFRVRERKATDIAVLLYSSGTTGLPKGAKLSHGNLAANLRTLVAVWGFGESDCLLHALPVYHAHGLLVALGCVLMSGSSMAFLPRFNTSQVITALPGCTVMMGVPTYYTRLLADTDFNKTVAARMRLFISGSAPLPPDVFHQFQERTGHTILERYGMTETCMNTSNPLQGEHRAGSVGPALPGVSIRVMDDHDLPLPPGTTGHLEVKGPNVFSGYWGLKQRRKEDFTTDGYFRTGDAAWIDTDGYIYIAGRSRDMIISGGLNVYPREVERVLDSLNEVAESAVIGAPHPDFGEGVVAVIVSRPGANINAEDVLNALRSRLAGYKLPRRLYVIDELPRNSMGKVLKNHLREQYANAFAATTAVPHNGL